MDESKEDGVLEDLQIREKKKGLPTEFMEQWQRLSIEDQKTFLQRMNLVDAGEVKVTSEKSTGMNLKLKKIGPFSVAPSENANKLAKVKSDKEDAQIEAVLEGIEFISKRNLPSGLVLHPQAVEGLSITRQPAEQGCGKIAEVLGRGNSAGDVIVIKNPETNKDQAALKTVLISQFNPNEIRLWVKLGREDVAPKLYTFELEGNKVLFTMEVMSGKDLDNVVDDLATKKGFGDDDLGLARDFSLCVLTDLLDIWDKMRQLQYVHGDMHAGNVRLETSMTIKIFDFGRAKSLLTADKPELLVKDDIVGIIRMFSLLYAGFDFESVFTAKAVLEKGDLESLNDYMGHISEENRNELYSIMKMLFDTVKGDKKLPEAGDTRVVAKHIKSLIQGDCQDIKLRAAAIIFPEKFQKKVEQEKGGYDTTDGGERSFDSPDCGRRDGNDLDPIWDHPDIDNFVCNVTDEDLKRLEAL